MSLPCIYASKVRRGAEGQIVASDATPGLLTEHAAAHRLLTIDWPSWPASFTVTAPNSKVDLGVPFHHPSNAIAKGSVFYYGLEDIGHMGAPNNADPWQWAQTSGGYYAIGYDALQLIRRGTKLYWRLSISMFFANAKIAENGAHFTREIASAPLGTPVGSYTFDTIFGAPDQTYMVFAGPYNVIATP